MTKNMLENGKAIFIPIMSWIIESHYYYHNDFDRGVLGAKEWTVVLVLHLL